MEDAVRAAIELAGGLGAVIPPRASVPIKPKVISPSSSGSGKIIDARVTQAVTEAVLDRSPGRAVIGRV